jgi:hypothetical protein
MKATELRIGNYIKYGFGICTVRGTSKDAIWLNDEGGPVPLDGGMNIEPVLLTDEWFEKFGFYKDGDYWSRSIYDYNFCFKYRDWANNWAFYQEFTNSNDPNDDGKKYEVSFDIKYVHQLQNLWYSLLHYEITAKED